ncbi:Target of rapamycin homolog [Caenorhabditis elegans]|uniref:Target of rapamycin homolog n=1 Tax=Caenorhabditis elegans TaxID=6239 RepID=UPI00000839E7|nr:Target of rapamycin homolog [Caenorhabditis elegans]CCD61569.1 Target of rapamycin homolog [Caenorhabditis elegans]|eukprot:NP_491549.2 Target of rapamycin homolog [Caenorhabditis elegans]
MLQQHGISFQMNADRQNKAATTSNRIVSAPATNEFDERHRKQGIDAARALASQYRSRITENRDANQRQAARELSRYVRSELKDEPNTFSDAFLNAIDGRTDIASQSAIYNCMKSNSNIDQKRAGIYLIVCLAETHSGNVIRYANYLLKMLNNGNGLDEDTVKMASKALAFLIATCKSYAAELVDRCLDHCHEWLGQNVPHSQQPKNQQEIDQIRRLAASHLSRELALATPTAFFLRVNLFFKYIFNAVRDKNPAVRIAGIDALHVVLTIVSQREAKNKTEWFKKCFDEALEGQPNPSQKDDLDRWHAVALILNELLRISDQRFELIRCESSQFIKQKFLKEDEEEGVEWLVLTKQQTIVESVTARKLVLERFPKILDCVRQIIPLANKTSSTKQQSSIYLNTVLMQLLPRICAFPQCDRTFQTISFDTSFTILQRNAVAAPAIGMMMLSNPDVHATHIEKTISFISAAIKKTTNSDVLDNYFTFLFLFVDAYHEQVTTQIKAIIPQLMDITLSRSLANVLKMIMMRIPKLRLNVQDGVMASVYQTLTGSLIPPKSEPIGRPASPKAILQKAETDPKELQRIVLAVDVLGEFYFSRGALQRIMQYVADYYLTADNVEIRLAAVSSCCEMVVPFVGVYKKVTSDKRNSLLQTIYGVLRAVCSVIVNDQDVRVRMQVISCFGQMPRPFLAHLAQPEMLEVQFMALHDEKLEMQQACVTLLGRLAELNPALVLPRLRLMLLETLSQMQQSGQARLEQHSAKMIAQLAKQSPKFMRPYVGSLMIAMIPKLRNDQKYAEVTAQVLNAVSEIAVIGGAEIVKNLKPLFEKLTHMINDSSSLHKREAALRAIGGICRSTAYVVDPYRDYPSLLDDLLRILKTVMSNTMRREAIKTLGILGAIDPYTHKVFTGSVQSSTAISTALSLPISETDSKDPRQDIIHWFNYEKCTLEEFYPAITIANLMLMMQDEDSQSYAEIAQAIVTIFRSLGDMAPLYTEQVIPRLIEVCRRATESSNRANLREFFLQQLANFVAIIRKHAAPYMPAIFTIIADAWKEDISVKMVVIEVLTDMGTAIGNDFSKYTGELIPYLLTVLQTDKTKERVLTVKVMESIQKLTHCIVQHLHLVLPPLLIILDDFSLKLSIRNTALSTVLHMTQQVDVSAYAPRMMQSWHHNISTAEMRDKLLLLLIEIIKQLGKFFDIFKRGVDQKLRDYNLDKSVHYEQYRKLAQRAQMSRDVLTSSVFAGSNGNIQYSSTQAGMRGQANNVYANNDLHERLMNGSIDSGASRQDNRDDYYRYGVEEKISEEVPKVAPTTARPTSELVTVQITKQRLNKDALMPQWKNENLTSKDEWLQWLMKIRIGFLTYGSSPSLRAASSLGDQHPHLARDLFPAAFMSVWTELDSDVQNDLTSCLLRAISTGIPELIQTILNLAEFMDHSEKGPLPISHDVLGRWAEQTKAFAKACRYKEMSVLKKSGSMQTTFTRKVKLEPNDCQSLITYANKLNVQEEAAGVVRYAERNEMNFQMRGRWYEKLNEWEKALGAYELEEKKKSSCPNLQVYDEKDHLMTPEEAATAEEARMHEMRCLEALGRWDELNSKSVVWADQRGNRNDSVRDEINKKQLDHKMAVIAARGAWAVDNWERMADYVSVISENTQDGAMLRAVVAVHNDENTKAMGLIEKVREMIDSELTAMANESYERAYIPMVSVQQMAELEEAIEYKTRPERRPRIALLWSRRLQGCRRNVEQWQRLIMLRGLVLSPQEMHPLRVKFSSMCRKQGKNSMSRAVLRELLSLPANSDLVRAKAPFDKPLLVLALAKQLYQDDHKDEAIRALEDLANHWNKRINPIPKATGRELIPPSTKEPARICAKVLLKLGEWTELKSKTSNNMQVGELSFVRQQVSPQYRTKESRTPETIAFENTINYYQQATQYDPGWHKVWHKLASTHFYAVCRERPHPTTVISPPQQPQQPKKMHIPPVTRATSPPPPAQKSPQPAPFHSITEPLSVIIDYPVPPPLGSLVGLPPMPAYLSSNSSLPPQHHHVSPLSNDSPSNSAENKLYLKHAAHAVRCFAKALMCSPGSRLEDTLRLMQLWFDHGDDKDQDVYFALTETIFDLPVTTWLEAIPQLMARLDCPDDQKSVQLVLRVLCEIARHRPQAVIYALTVASRSKDVHRSKNAGTVLEKMMEYHSKLVREASLVTEELVRCAILWHEQWHDALDDASRVYFHDNNVQAMFDALRNMNDLMQKGAPTTMKEHSFQQTYSSDLKEAGRYVQAFESSGNVKDLNQAWEIYCSVFKKLRDQLATLNSLDLVYVSPNLVSAKDLELVVPGTYDPSAPIVSIQSFSSKMNVITSKQRPRKMVIRGSNGLDYQFLLKGHEDPRQDERVMQLFGLVNTLLANNSETCRRNLTIQRYSIVALSKDSGLIGWVPNCDTLHTLVKEYREKKAKIPLSIEHKTLQKLSLETEHLTLMQKLQLFESALSVTQGEDLRHVLWLKSPSSEVWFDRRTNYTRSVACMSMVGYILGLGDRHPSNLMLDRLTGKVVHIDFGDCFEVAMLREKFPERVPFRLTRMLINAMEVTGLDGVYNYTAERVLKMLRTNQESLLAVLEAFVYDPVINWRLVEGMKKDPKTRKDTGGRQNMAGAVLPSSSTTDSIMETIKRKLDGTEFVHTDGSTPPEPLQVTEQLAMLTEQATSPLNLCQSYIGWCPFW